MQFHQNAEKIEVDENEKTVKSCNTSNNNMKGSQLMTFRINVIQLRMLWTFRLKLKLTNLLRSMLNK